MHHREMAPAGLPFGVAPGSNFYPAVWLGSPGRTRFLLMKSGKLNEVGLRVVQRSIP